MAEAMRLGIAIRGPHVNHSDSAFSLIWEDDQAVLWMGLGWVRNLRRRSVRAIRAARKQRLFASLRDLAMRVPLRRRELEHLVQCGALDGLGESRAALLAECGEILRAESALQLSLGLERPAVAPESLAQRLRWEQRVLGCPVSALRDPLATVRDRVPRHVPLRHLPETRGRPVAVAGVRLPGWTGGEGFYLWDGDSWAIVRADRSAPPRPAVWRPLLLHGHWVADSWGIPWFQMREMELPAP
jgi:hypothetical protein